MGLICHFTKYYNPASRHSFPLLTLSAIVELRKTTAAGTTQINSFSAKTNVLLVHGAPKNSLTESFTKNIQFEKFGPREHAWKEGTDSKGTSPDVL